MKIGIRYLILVTIALAGAFVAIFARQPLGFVATAAAAITIGYFFIRS